MPTKKETPAKQAERVEVVLLKEHTHRGKSREKGKKIKVTTAQVNWLKKQKVIA